MRAWVLALALAAAGLALAGCGQGSSSSESSQTASTTVPLTPDQAKALVASLPAPFSTGDIENGRAKFTQCAACHTTAQGGPNMTGPNLYGIFGRHAGAQPDFAYSDIMKVQSFNWDAQRIDTWITDPRAMLPGTKMSFVGLPDPKDRIDLIAYLKTATSPPPT